MPDTKLLTCHTSYFCCGVVVDPGNTVIDAAPILAWSIGKPFAVLRDWLYRRGGTWQVTDSG